jgi:hypothetical protein
MEIPFCTVDAKVPISSKKLLVFTCVYQNVSILRVWGELDPMF